MLTKTELDAAVARLKAQLWECTFFVVLGTLALGGMLLMGKFIEKTRSCANGLGNLRGSNE